MEIFISPTKRTSGISTHTKTAPFRGQTGFEELNCPATFPEAAHVFKYTSVKILYQSTKFHLTILDPKVLL